MLPPGPLPGVRMLPHHWCAASCAGDLERGVDFRAARGQEADSLGERDVRGKPLGIGSEVGELAELELAPGIRIKPLGVVAAGGVEALAHLGDVVRMAADCNRWPSLLPRSTCQRPAITLKKLTGWSLSQTTVRRPSLTVSAVLVPTELMREIGRPGDRDLGRERRSSAHERVGLPLVEVVAVFLGVVAILVVDADFLHVAQASARCVGRKLVNTTAEGRMNSDVPAPSLADSPRISPLVLEPDPHLLAGSESSPRRREDKKPRVVLGRAGLPSIVHESFSQCGPPVSRISSSGWSLGLTSSYVPRDVVAASARERGRG